MFAQMIDVLVTGTTGHMQTFFCVFLLRILVDIPENSRKIGASPVEKLCSFTMLWSSVTTDNWYHGQTSGKICRWKPASWMNGKRWPQMSVPSGHLAV